MFKEGVWVSSLPLEVTGEIMIINLAVLFVSHFLTLSSGHDFVFLLHFELTRTHDSHRERSDRTTDALAFLFCYHSMFFRFI